MKAQDKHYFYLLGALAFLALMGILILIGTNQALVGQAAKITPSEQEACQYYCSSANVQVSTLNTFHTCSCLSDEGRVLKAMTCGVRESCW